MKNRLPLIWILFFCAITVHAQQTLKQTRQYSWHVNSGSHADSVLSGLESVRCIAVGDLNNDGKNEIVATNYSDLGHVHVFARAATDTFELVWSSPTVDAEGGNSTPRNVLIGDMDKDGRNEIIFESRGNGVFVYEWDGNPGYNFGTKPSQLISSTSCTGFPVVTGNAYTEKMSLADVDNDGQQELVMAMRSATLPEQKYMIIRANGEWTTDDAGFSSFDMVYMAARPDLAAWGFALGSAWCMMPANFDGEGNKEVLIQAYNKNNITILRNSTGTWELADTTNGKQNLFLTSTDGVSYFGGAVSDVDKDGRDEVYLPTYVSGSPELRSLVHGVYFDAPTTPNEIDSAANTFVIDFSPLTGTNYIWGYGAGDIDGNGKSNLYFTTDKLGASIVTAEFQGGLKKDPANWKTSVVWNGDTCDYSLVLRDSLGKVDTVSRVSEYYFPSKIAVADLYGNGKQQIIAGYQPWYYGAPNTDSVRITKYTWNSALAKYDSTNFKVLNPKRYSFVVLEAGPGTGVEARPLTLITPEDYTLQQNYPNPFNPSTEIHFTLPLTKRISIKVYDMLGREVRTLINNDEYVKGSHAIVWNGQDNFGTSVASGSYICTLRIGAMEKSMKMMLLK